MDDFTDKIKKIIVPKIKNIKINESLLFNFPCLGKRLQNVFEKLLIILILRLEATSAILLNSPKKFSKEHS